MSSKLVLTLWGNLQSYGTSSLAYDRGAGDFPSRSAVTGMILCAMGADGPQVDLLAKMAGAFTVTVHSYGERRLLEDYHTISSGYKDLAKAESCPKKGKAAWTDDHVLERWYTGMCLRAADKEERVQGAGNKITTRQYWVNRVYFVVLDFHDQELASEVSKALVDPVGTLVLGRRCCSPKVTVHSGLLCSSWEEVYALIASELAKVQDLMRGCRALSKPVKLTPSGSCFDTHIEGAQRWVRNDVPVQFGRDKRYTSREVWVKQG